MQDDAKRLEPCPNPWCNSHKTTDTEIRAMEAPILMPSRASSEWAVACPVCPVQTPFFDTEVAAIATWNTRTPAPAQPELVERVARETRHLTFNAITMDEHRDVIRAALAALGQGGVR